MCGRVKGKEREGRTERGREGRKEGGKVRRERLVLGVVVGVRCYKMWWRVCYFCIIKFFM